MKDHSDTIGRLRSRTNDPRIGSCSILLWPYLMSLSVTEWPSFSLSMFSSQYDLFVFRSSSRWGVVIYQSPRQFIQHSFLIECRSAPTLSVVTDTPQQSLGRMLKKDLSVTTLRSILWSLSANCFLWYSIRNNAVTSNVWIDLGGIREKLDLPEEIDFSSIDLAFECSTEWI